MGQSKEKAGRFRCQDRRKQKGWDEIQNGTQMNKKKWKKKKRDEAWGKKELARDARQVVFLGKIAFFDLSPRVEMEIRSDRPLDSVPWLPNSHILASLSLS